MNPSERKIKGFFKFGEYESDEIEFNESTNMVDVNNYIHRSLCDVLRGKFHVSFYNCQARKILLLDQDLLNSKNNPFRFNSTNDCPKRSRKITSLIFYLEDDSHQDDPINVQPNSVVDALSISDLDGALAKSTFLDELDTVLLSSPLTPNSSNGVISLNNVAMDDEDDDDDVNENITNENSGQSPLYPRSNSRNSTSSSSDYQLATETTDVNNIQSERIQFSPDVHPEQKHHYLSNQFSTSGESSEKNSGISRIQGLKTENEVKSRGPILPHLLIPRSYHQMERLTLLMYAVYEEIGENAMRIWYKNYKKGFLSPNQLQADAEFSNPIRLNLTNSQWSPNGDYVLDLYLLTMQDKTRRNKEEICRLSETAIAQIHPAKHVQCSKRKSLKPTRLICVPEINNRLHWSAFGLSDFIQPPSKKPAGSSPTPTSSTTVQVALPADCIGVLNIYPIHRENLPLVHMGAIHAVSPPPKRQKMSSEQ